MRIAIDGRLLEAGDTGGGAYLRLLVRALARGDDGHEYVLIGRSPGLSGLRPGARFQWAASPGAGLFDERWEQLVLPGLLAELRPQVYFGAASVLPAVKTCRQVSLISDVSIEEEPGYYPSPVRRYLSRWLRAAADQSDRVVTISEHAKLGICGAYGLPPTRVDVTPLAPEEAFEPIPDDEARAQVLAHYGISGHYLLSHVGAEPNGNLRSLLQVYRAAGAASGLGSRLVLLGGQGRDQLRLQQLVAERDLSGDVVPIEQAPRAHLPSLYSGATCFIWLSRYEDLGLPPLEAMACGTPVMAADRASLPELLGDAAVLVDFSRPADTAKALRRLVTDMELRQDLRGRGLRRRSGLSWRRTAELTRNALTRAAEGRAL